MQPRLKSGLWVRALIRRYDGQAIPAAVLRKGDEDAGAILIKVSRREHGCIVLNRTQNPAGELVWQRGTGPEPVDEATADAYIARQASRDPDLWVVEIEAGTGEIMLDGTAV
ncbi:MAG TPA: DUF1491 family protein [Stellaceae bacterium]|jgi:hypothetical protein|nr:DUF1491 family protein [Stellaceae bacterium]